MANHCSLEITDLYNELRIFIEDMLSTSVREGNSCPSAFLVDEKKKREKKQSSLFLSSSITQLKHRKASEQLLRSH